MLLPSDTMLFRQIPCYFRPTPWLLRTSVRHLATSVRRHATSVRHHATSVRHHATSIRHHATFVGHTMLLPSDTMQLPLTKNKLFEKFGHFSTKCAIKPYNLMRYPATSIGHHATSVWHHACYVTPSAPCYFRRTQCILLPSDTMLLLCYFRQLKISCLKFWRFFDKMCNKTL